MVDQHCKTFTAMSSFFWKLSIRRTRKNLLWSCYRLGHKPRPLATLTSSSKAEILYLLSLLVRRATHHRQKLQRLHEGWRSSNKALLHQSNDTYKLSNIWAVIPPLWNCPSICNLLQTYKPRTWSFQPFFRRLHIHFGKSATNSHVILFALNQALQFYFCLVLWNCA